MKILYDYFPIVCFFVAYKLYGIYTATVVTMGAVVLQVLLHWAIKKRFERTHLISLVCILGLGGATLFFHNPIFIQWKPSLVYWAFALAFIITQYFTPKPLMARLLDTQVQLPAPIWNRLNLAWAIFFGLMGWINLYVVYHYDTETWVHFKLFGTLSATLVFALLQGWYVHKKAESVST